MNPYVVKEKARAVILSYKASGKLIDLVESQGIEIIFSKETDIDPRIADHPDLQIHPINHETFVAARDCYDYYVQALEKYDKKVLLGGEILGYDYPKDCLYNVARLDNYFIYNSKAIDKVLNRYLLCDGQSPIEVKQGYAKCMCICFDNFIITNDRGIQRKLIENGLESYLVSEEGIGLDGFSSGFLGGSCGIIDNMKLLFTGDIRKLKEYNKLMDICSHKDIDIIYPDADLVDLGSIIPIL